MRKDAGKHEERDWVVTMTNPCLVMRKEKSADRVSKGGNRSRDERSQSWEKKAKKKKLTTVVYNHLLSSSWVRDAWVKVWPQLSESSSSETIDQAERRASSCSFPIPRSEKRSCGSPFIFLEWRPLVLYKRISGMQHLSSSTYTHLFLPFDTCSSWPSVDHSWWDRLLVLQASAPFLVIISFLMIILCSPGLCINRNKPESGLQPLFQWILKWWGMWFR